MKKLWFLVILALAFSACGKSNKNTDNLAPVIQNKYSMTADKTVDVDLTIMSSTMVYAEVNAMMTEPEKYEGKRIKINGAMSSFTDQTSGNTYYACIIKDATACCAQGLEFTLADENEKYPDLSSEITVKGIFETYQEGDYYYCRLRDAKIV